MKLLLQFNHKLPITLLQVFPKVLFDSINGLPAHLHHTRRVSTPTCQHHSTHACTHARTHTFTLLTRRSVSSKCRPTSLGASPGTGSILMHTSWPLRAVSTALWLTSKLVTTPRSQNCKHNIWGQRGRVQEKLLGTRGECQLHKTCHTYPYISCGDRQRSALLHHASLNFHSNYNGVSLVEDTVWQYPKLTREDRNVFVLLTKALLQLLCRINDKGTAPSAPNLSKLVLYQSVFQG